METSTAPPRPSTSQQAPGSHQVFFPVSPKYSAAGNLAAKSSLATFPEFSHFGPGRHTAGTTFLRER